MAIDVVFRENLCTGVDTSGWGGDFGGGAVYSSGGPVALINSYFLSNVASSGDGNDVFFRWGYSWGNEARLNKIRIYGTTVPDLYIKEGGSHEERPQIISGSSCEVQADLSTSACFNGTAMSRHGGSKVGGSVGWYHSCAPCGVCGVDTYGPDYTTCAPCTSGRDCPPGSEIDGVESCPADFYCPDTKTQIPCTAGRTCVAG